MSVKIINFETWEYQHDDAPGGSHGGTLDPATVTYGTNIDGEPNVNVVAVPCPFEGCGSVSYWPPGGGADALLGQSLHVMVGLNAQPVARGAPRDTASVVEDVKQRVIATDGIERWVLDEVAMAALEATLGGR
jgi:hypothetical protein